MNRGKLRLYSKNSAGGYEERPEVSVCEGLDPEKLAITINPHLDSIAEVYRDLPAEEIAAKLADEKVLDELRAKHPDDAERVKATGLRASPEGQRVWRNESNQEQLNLTPS